jgi:EAL domain-containing protein (putative c-di-GMP-specific phosphodiesterase class I)
VLDDDLLALVYQPIFDLRTGALFGCEALSRITSAPVRPPDEWFAEAMAVGLGPEFEAKAVEKAIGALSRLPPGVVVSANLSPQTVFSPYLLGVLGSCEDRASRLVLEITEHAAVDHYEVLVRMLARLRRLGVRIAVDDAGAGYASFHHILNLSPDIIKLDKVLIDTIDTDTARQALVRALRAFAAEIGSRLCAEGVERPEQLDVLVHLGVDLAQGYLFARPAPLDDVFDAHGHTVSLPKPAELVARFHRIGG